MSIFTMCESTCSLYRASIGRDTAGGVTQEFDLQIATNIPCSQQEAGVGKQQLYAQNQAVVTTTLYFAQDPQTEPNDYAIVTDRLGKVAQYLIQGEAQPIGRGVVWSVDVQRVRASTTTPTVISPTATGVTTTTATLGGRVTSDGGNPLATVGVVYSLTADNPTPTVGGTGCTSLTTDAALGVFVLPVTDLVPASPYTYRAYASNNNGIGYSSLATFTTS